MQQVFDKIIDTKIAALDKTREIVLKHDKKQPTRLWLGAGALLGAIVAGLIAGYLQRDFSQRNIEYMPDMAYSKAWVSQQPHHYPEWLNNAPLPAYIAEWRTADMPPPDGTLYRGQKTLAIRAGTEGLEEAAGLSNPYAGLEGAELEAVRKRGGRLFIKNCQGCHGVDGIGGAPVTLYGVGAPAIDTATIRDKHKDGQLFHIITYGFNTMPAHASHVNYDDRWKVIMYLRSLQEGK